MRDGKTVGVQLSGDTLGRVEAHRSRLQATAGTVRITTSDAVRDLLLIGLHAAEHDETNQS